MSPPEMAADGETLSIFTVRAMILLRSHPAEGASRSEPPPHPEDKEAERTRNETTSHHSPTPGQPLGPADGERLRYVEDTKKYKRRKKIFPPVGPQKLRRQRCERQAKQRHLLAGHFVKDRLMRIALAKMLFAFRASPCSHQGQERNRDEMKRQKRFGGVLAKKDEQRHRP